MKVDYVIVGLDDRASSDGRARNSWSRGRGFDPRYGRPFPTS